MAKVHKADQLTDIARKCHQQGEPAAQAARDWRKSKQRKSWKGSAEKNACWQAATSHAPRDAPWGSETRKGQRRTQPPQWPGGTNHIL